MTIQNDIAPDERLGRGVFSSRYRDRSRRGTVPHHVFLERPGNVEISVDRIDLASSAEATKIADSIATARNTTFHGWAVITARQACANERQAVATPQLDNPYHADIVLPALTAEDREIQKRHAHELADASKWRERMDIN